MVAMIVGDEQGTLRQIAFCQPFHFKHPILQSTRQFLAIIDEQSPSVTFVFCDTTPYLVRTSMNGNGHYIELVR